MITELARRLASRYVEAGRPLLPVTRWVRGPLRWYFHRSRVLRHDVRGNLAARLLSTLHRTLVADLPSDLTVYGGRLALRSAGSTIGVHAYYVGEFELHLSRFLVSRIQAGSVIVDVGAHHGVHTLVAALELAQRGGAGQVHAFEPDPGNCGLLRQNVERNHLSAFVTIHEAAVTDRDGDEVLLVCEGDNSSNTLQENRDVALAPGERTVARTVRSVRLDGLLQSVPRVDILKIDVQGAEARVLRGGLGLLARDRPVILVEAVPGWRTSEEVRTILEELRYRIVGVDEDGNTCPLGSPRVFVSWDWIGLPG